VRVETELRLPVPTHKQDENQGLRTERQITLYRQREEAKRQRAERCEAEARAREAEARVRHLNFELIQRVVLLVLGLSIGIAAVIGALGDPALLKFAGGTAAAWGGIAGLLYRWGGREKP
jgi:hypothetical protein